MSTVISYGRDVEESIRRIERTLKRDPKITSMYNTRWLAIKLLEEDEEVIKRLKESSLFNDIIKVSGEERNKLSAKYGDVEVLLADVRYKVIEDIVRRVVRGRKVAYTLSDLLDKAILDRILGIPIFLIVLWVMFQFTMLVTAHFCNLVGDFLEW